MGHRKAKAMPRHARAPASVYAIFNYCVGASGVPASVLNIVGNQPLWRDIGIDGGTARTALGNT